MYCKNCKIGTAALAVMEELTDRLDMDVTACQCFLSHPTKADTIIPWPLATDALALCYFVKTVPRMPGNEAQWKKIASELAARGGDVPVLVQAGRSGKTSDWICWWPTRNGVKKARLIDFADKLLQLRARAERNSAPRAKKRSRAIRKNRRNGA